MNTDNEKTENQLLDGKGSDASTCSACNGCQWQGQPGGEWCYMFDDAPENLPCAQHDKYETERKMAAAILKKNPALFSLMAMGEFNPPNVKLNRRP